MCICTCSYTIGKHASWLAENRLLQLTPAPSHLYLIAKKLRRQMCYFQESRVRSQETLRLLIRQRDLEQDVWGLLQRDRLLLLSESFLAGKNSHMEPVSGITLFDRRRNLVRWLTLTWDFTCNGLNSHQIGLLWPLLVCREISQVSHHFQMWLNLYDLENSTNKWDPWIF